MKRESGGAFGSGWRIAPKTGACTGQNDITSSPRGEGHKQGAKRRFLKGHADVKHSYQQ